MTCWAWIGEHGPELLSLPEGAQVVPLPEPADPETPEGRP